MMESDNNELLNIIRFPQEVQNVIEKVLPSADPLDLPDFNSVEYINSLFPTEQSLSNIDDVICKMEYKISCIDDDIRNVVRGQTNVGQDGCTALEEAQKVIRQLFVHIKDIKMKAEKSEEMVREITRDIKQLDCAKRNLTSAITTLNHLHMLVGGVDNLKLLTQKRLYGEVVMPLQAIIEVMLHFSDYMDIPQIKELADQVSKVQTQLSTQITSDFHEAFSGPNAKSFVPNKQLADACLVVSILEPKVKKDILKWFIGLQLQEYLHLFHENQDPAWLDKIDKRYVWLKRHLLEFENKFGAMFPINWEVSERITVQFCHITRDELSKLMAKRKQEIDVKLLLYAIQKTSNFENLLSRRFTGVTLEDKVIDRRGSSKITTNLLGNALEENESESQPEDQSLAGDPSEKCSAVTDSPFIGLIGVCFVPYLYIYIESIDRNLAEYLERFVQDSKSLVNSSTPNTFNVVFPSCADLFMFYKKCLVQCTQLSRGQSMLNLSEVFKKYLREYALKILQNNLPKIGTTSQSLGTSMSSITRDIQNLNTSGIIQNFHSLLKEGEIPRFTKEELAKICCILTTAEYCLETTQQLEDKLKEKIEETFLDKINLSQEHDMFHTVISNCIQLLVQDLEISCEPALTTMSKMQWQNIRNVGDQSPYVNVITSYLKQNIPIIRDYLSSSRKYFTQFCVKFVNSFIPKFIQHIYKCRPIGVNVDNANNTVGCEQLLLDTHSLKTVLLDLPSLGSQVNRKAPASYTKVVVKGMTKAEMLLKVVMAPIHPPQSFTEQFLKLLPECHISEFHKVLDMKGLKRGDQTALVELFRSQAPHITVAEEDSQYVHDSPDHDTGRIRKLEKLIKKRLPN